MIGIAISIALLTQIDGETFARAGLIMALGLVIWVVNWLIVRGEDEPAASLG